MTRQEAAARRRDGRSEAKGRAIVEAATRTFTKHGYGRSSMDAIAREAGVSKQTIYHHYGSKEALFGAIVSSRCEQLLQPLQAPDLHGESVDRALRSLASEFLRLILSPSSLGLYRVIIAEAHQFPELGRISYEHGPRAAVQVLAAYLRGQTQRGRLTVSDPELSAEQFFGMLTGHVQLRALLEVQRQPSPERRKALIDNAVATFLAAHAG